MKITSRRLILGTLGMVAIVGALWVYLIYSSGERAVARYKRQLVARGEKLRIEDWWPKLPEQNGAIIFFKAQTIGLSRISVLESNAPAAMRLAAPGKSMIGWTQPEVRGSLTNSWEEVEAALAPKQAAFQELEKLIEQPYLDFQLDYEQGFDLLLPHLSQLKSSASRLSAGVVCDLHRNEPEPAIRKARTILALARGMKDEPLIISQLVRIAIAQIAMNANWELLQATNLTDAQLFTLQHDWIELDFLGGAQAALGMEGAMLEAMIARMRRSSAEFRRVANGWSVPGRGPGPGAPWWEQLGEATALKAKETVWRVAWSYPDELRSLRGHQAIFEAARLASTQGAFKPALDQQERRLSELGLKKESDNERALFDLSDLDMSSFFSSSILSLQGFLQRTMVADVSRQLTLAAIALRRYQLRYGTNAPDLVALVPEFLERIPRDPVDGKNLRYRIEPTGAFTLYSVGADGEDNSGDPSPAPPKTSRPSISTLRWQNGKDLVWPKPATTAEVDAYYQDEGKHRH